MNLDERNRMWRQAVKIMHSMDWLLTYQDHGGECMVALAVGYGVTSTWHEGSRIPGVFLCTACRKVVIRGEGRWWE